MGCLAASVTAGSGWASLLEVVADYTRLSAVRAARYADRGRASGQQNPGAVVPLLARSPLSVASWVSVGNITETESPSAPTEQSPGILFLSCLARNLPSLSDALTAPRSVASRSG